MTNYSARNSAANDFTTVIAAAGTKKGPEAGTSKSTISSASRKAIVRERLRAMGVGAAPAPPPEQSTSGTSTPVTNLPLSPLNLTKIGLRFSKPQIYKADLTKKKV